jgi:hypothetical protein
VLTSQILLHGESAPRPPADLFVPTQRAARDPEPDPAPTPAEPDQAEADQDEARPAGVGSSGVRSSGLRPLAIMAVLLMGLLGVVAVATFPERDQAMSRETPPVTPDQRSDDPDTVGIAVVGVQAGTSVTLPGPDSRDWVAPGAGSDGALVRADLTEESIEFRAGNTQPGLPGTFRMSWSGGDATTILGVRPGGWVDFVIRPLASPADLVMHLSGNDVAVTVDTGNGSTRKVLSADAAVVTVALPAATAAAVRVAPAGDQEIGVATAELQQHPFAGMD